MDLFVPLSKSNTQMNLLKNNDAVEFLKDGSVKVGCTVVSGKVLKEVYEYSVKKGRG